MATNCTLLCLADNIYKPPSQKRNTIRKENRNDPFSTGNLCGIVDIYCNASTVALMVKFFSLSGNALVILW